MEKNITFIYGLFDINNPNVIKYIGKSGDGLTNGNYYEVLEQERNYEYFYFIDDNNKFVGIRKINYLGGSPNFIEVTKVRQDKIKELGI